MPQCQACPYDDSWGRWHQIRDRAESRYPDKRLRNSCTQNAGGDRERSRLGAEYR